MATGCALCESVQAELRRLREENAVLLKANAAQKEELVDLAKLCTLQRADLDRLEAERAKSEPNRPERVRQDELQLVFAELLLSYGAAAAQNDESATASTTLEGASDEGADQASQNQPGSRANSKKGRSNKKRGGRRPLGDLENLPVEPFEIIPPEVLKNPDAYRRLEDETSDRIAHRAATYIILRLIRPKFVLIASEGVDSGADANGDAEHATLDAIDVCDPPLASSPRPARIVCAEIPGSLWPRTMADVSAITQVILSKYDMCLPLNRQERASARCGFYLPRSTQCDWIEAAYAQTYRIVDAMMADSMNAHCIGTDATGAPVRMRGGSVNWHVFVFIADASHVVFRPTRHHDGDAIRDLLGEYRGFLLADAATIYDALYESGHIIEVSCWAHLRRYFWKARSTEPRLATEALAIIAKIFEVGRDAWEIPMPERTEARARLVQPHLDLLDAWVERVRPGVDAKSPLAAALTYYKNQHATLRTFLKDGHLRLDNNLCEQQLRNLVLGRHNWHHFETRAGLDWYCVFRSLIASCALHGLEPQDYLNEVLRLAPHWSTAKMLDLSPRYWAETRAALSEEQKAIITPPWLSSSARSAAA